MRAKIVLPEGYYFSFDGPVKNNPDIGFFLHSRKAPVHDTFVGWIVLKPVGREWLATHSHLKKDYRGKGLGTLLYAHAIQWAIRQGYRVRSSGYTSDDALRVWNGLSLRKYFKIRSRKNKLNPNNTALTTYYVYQK